MWLSPQSCLFLRPLPSVPNQVSLSLVFSNSCPVLVSLVREHGSLDQQRDVFKSLVAEVKPYFGFSNIDFQSTNSACGSLNRQLNIPRNIN